MTKRTYGGPLIDVAGAVDLHCHPYPDLFPRLADDFDIVRAARDAGMKAIVLKCHHENTVSRAYLVQRVIPGIRVFGGIVLNYYVGGINAAAVEASLKLGGKEVWMPTVDAGYHAEVHGGTGGYDSQKGGRSQAEGIWVADKDGKLKPEVKEVLELVAEYGAILATSHLAPREIVALVREARSVGVEKIVITHPYFRVPNLDLDTLEEVARMGAMPEFGYCTVSPGLAVRRAGEDRAERGPDRGVPLPARLGHRAAAQPAAVRGAAYLRADDLREGGADGEGDPNDHRQPPAAARRGRRLRAEPRRPGLGPRPGGRPVRGPAGPAARPRRSTGRPRG